MIRNTLRKGLSMIELVMVIVILGIVASIGAEIIANVYEGYLVQRAQHRASIKTELVATQIANRLAYAIPGTVVRKVALNGALPGDATNIDIPRGDDPAILQWVGADIDSFKSRAAANILPGWSGFCDVDASTATNIVTPGSDTALIAPIRNNLGLNNGPAQIYFPTSTGLISAAVQNIVGPNIPLTATATYVDGGAAPSSRVEHYKLASSSYALEARVATRELWLHYNFAPQKRVAINGQRQLLLRNVTTFEFRGDGRTIRFKICVNEAIASDANITICKEKAVF